MNLIRSIWRGWLSLFTWYHPVTMPDRYDPSLSGIEMDMRALQGDCDAVMGDLEVVIRMFQEEIESEGK